MPARKVLRGALYIRQSRLADPDSALSQPVQLAAGRRLAEKDGINPDKLRVFTDLGRSGGAGKEHRRPEYQALLAAVEAGEIDVLYTLSLTRIARSAGELERVFALFDRMGVRLVSAHESFDPTTASGRAMFAMMAVFATFERDLAVERQMDNIAERKRRNERLGPIPYAEKHPDLVDAVVGAYLECRSFGRASFLLNERKITPPRAKLWNRNGVMSVVSAVRPDLLPVKRTARVKTSGGFLFSRLLRCRCGKLLTGARNRNTYVYYRCHSATERPEHGKPYMIAEDKIMDRVRAELALVEVAAAEYERGDDNVAQRLAVLEGRRDRLRDLYELGDIERADYLTRKAEIEDRVADLAQESRSWTVAIPDVTDASVPAGVTNGVLREVFRYVELDADMLPVRFEWMVPEWRARAVPAAAVVA